MARRFCRWPSPWGPGLAGLALLLVVRAWNGGPAASRDTVSVFAAEFPLRAGPCRIERTIDGNTLLIAQDAGAEESFAPARHYRLRLLGIVLPDQHQPGDAAQQAAAVLRKLTFSGAARIELDRRRAAVDGCWLAHVYAGETLFSEALLRAGCGRYELYPGDSAARGRQLKAAEQFAQRNHLGIWR